jgi:hypothetical protein
LRRIRGGRLARFSPATTAAAITTFSTGATPAEHGILGWHLHLADLGLVGTILPVVTRTGVPLADARFNLARYLRLPVYLDSIRGGKQLLSYGAIPFSRFSRAAAAGARAMPLARWPVWSGRRSGSRAAAAGRRRMCTGRNTTPLP